jgi:hypothetical protein
MSAVPTAVPTYRLIGKQPWPRDCGVCGSTDVVCDVCGLCDVHHRHDDADDGADDDDDENGPIDVCDDPPVEEGMTIHPSMKTVVGDNGRVTLTGLWILGFPTRIDVLNDEFEMLLLSEFFMDETPFPADRWEWFTYEYWKYEMKELGKYDDTEILDIWRSFCEDRMVAKHVRGVKITNEGNIVQVDEAEAEDEILDGNLCETAVEGSDAPEGLDMSELSRP